MTTKELRTLMVKAESLEAIQLAKAAHDKRVKQHAGDIIVALSLHDVIEHMEEREKWLYEQEGKGIDAVARRAQQDEAMKIYCYQKHSVKEADALWEIYADSGKRNEEEMQRIVNKAKVFVNGQ